MSDYNRIDNRDLDNYITGHWGEDSVSDEPCEHCANPDCDGDCQDEDAGK